MIERSAARRRGRGFDDDTANSLGYLLRDTSRLVLRDVTARLEPHGISLPQYHVLRELWQEEGLTQRELANRVGILEPTMVATLDALETGGFVVRARSNHDRRKIHVYLGVQAKALEDTILGYAAATLDRALENVPDDAIEFVRSVLLQMKANLTRADRD